MNLSCDVLKVLAGKTLVTAESCTGGGIGSALTAVPGSSEVYKGGVISYTNYVKEQVLGVEHRTLKQYGAVSQPVAERMAEGVRKLLDADVAVSVTGLAGPGGDGFGNSVGTVFIGYCDQKKLFAKGYSFSGNREDIRKQAICAALELVLLQNK